MKITIELNGVKVQKDIPISWDGERPVTFKEFLQLAEAKDLAARLAIFTGVEVETLRKIKISNLGTITGLLSFIDNTEIDMRVPKEIMGYAMPKDLGLETIGQFEDMKAEAMKMKDKDITPYAMFCAIYATNPYDYKEAEKKVDIFMNAPCSEVLAIGNFTLVKLIESTNPSLIEAPKSPSRRKKARLAMTGWLSRLVFTARYYSWKRKLRIKETSY